MMAALDATTSKAVDATLATLFYTENVAFNVVELKRFKRVVTLMKSAPPSFKLPTRQHHWS
eukprot:6176370-Pleurochrysis_carterae.AAC.1